MVTALISATAGNESGDRWGLTGSEDLGGGNKALFKLENGFTLNGALGQGGLMFGRQAFVGIRNDHWGTVTLGRQYNVVQDYLGLVQIVDTGAMTAYGLSVYDNDDLNNTYRANNSIKYSTPTVAGLTVEAQYAFSNSAGQFSNNRAWSIGADYVRGGLRVDAAYSLLDHPATNANGATSANNDYSTATSIISKVARDQVFGAGAVYKFGKATATLLYTGSRFDMLAGGSMRFANYQAGFSYLFTPAVLVSLGYIYTDQQSSAASATDAHYHLMALGCQYYLSKATDLYVNGIFQRASGANAWIEAIPAPSTTGNQFVAVIDMRHKFWKASSAKPDRSDAWQIFQRLFNPAFFKGSFNSNMSVRVRDGSHLWT